MLKWSLFALHKLSDNYKPQICFPTVKQELTGIRS